MNKNVSTVIIISLPIILFLASCHKKDNVFSFNKDLLVANYMLDGDALDQSDSAFDGIVHGAVLTTGRKNKLNTAYLFNGYTDFIELPPQMALNIDSSFSVEAWILKNGYTSDGKYFDDVIYGQSDGQFGTDYPLVAFEVNGNKTLRGVIRGVDNPALNVISTDTITNNTWNHLVLVWDSRSKNLALYINGLIVNQNTVVLVGNTVSNDFVSIGAMFDDLEMLYHFYCGKIDELRIWRKALTKEEIDILKSGNFRFI
jgi:hypothetical protein